MSATDVWKSPEWYPVGIDRGARRMQFVRMSPHAYRASVFLDSRTHHLDHTCTLRMDDLLSARPDGSPEPVHYVFHTAFCCSTLLARYMEQLPGVLVLKEPGLLSHLAVAPPGSHPEWRDTATLTLALLARRYAGGQVCIKASDWCNGIADFILAADPAATATFVTVPLRRFLLAVLKSPGRRRWAHARARLAGRGHRTDVGSLTSAQAAAYVWLANAELCRRLQDGPDGGRVGVLDGDELAARPEACVAAVVAGSCLHAETSRVAVSRMYSKGGSRAFDAGTRSRELDHLDGAFGDEADSAVAWAVAGRW